MIFGLRALLFSAFFVLASNVLQNVYIPTKAVSMGMNTFEVSLLGSFYFIGFVLGCLFLPRFLYAVGHIRTFCSFAALSATSTLIISMTENPEIWMFCRLLTGVCLAALYFSIESWINGFSTQSNRGRIISIYRTVDIFGCLAGQYILFSFADFNQLLNITAIGFLLSMLPLSLTQIQTPVLVESSSDQLINIFKTVFKSTPLGLIGVTLSGFASGIFWSLTPVFTKSNLLDVTYNPIIVVCYLVGGAVLQWPLGIISDKVDRRKVIMFSSFVALMSCWAINILIYQSLVNLNMLFLLFAFMGAGSIPIYSLAIAHTNDLVKRSSFVGLSVLMLIMSSLGSVVGPFLFGSASSLVGSKYIFVFSASAHTLLFLISLHYVLTKEKIKQANKKVFLFLARTNSILTAGIKVR